MLVRICILCWVALFGAAVGFAQPAVRPLPRGQVDSAKIDAQFLESGFSSDSLDAFTARNRQLYDSIASKSRRKAVPRLLYQLLFVNAPEHQPTGDLYDEARMLAPYAGKIIDEVRIERDNPFTRTGSWIGRAGNKLNVLTHEGIIRRDLLFGPGQRFDPEQVVRSQQLLLSRSYISDADVIVQVNPYDTTHVSITLRTRDRWSIRLNAGLHSEKRVSIGLSDDNIFGTGSRLTVETNLRRTDFAYGGNYVGYEMPNFLGSFFSLEFEAGRSFFENTLLFRVSKDFLMPTDYQLGASYANLRTKVYFVDRDSSELYRVRNFDLWGGWSQQLPAIRSSLYIGGRFLHNNFIERPPETDARTNPALHSGRELLGSIGLYRERLYMTNMVYGFGRKEYLAAGYRAQLVSGYTWSEFGESVYAGSSLHLGGITRIGYLVGGFTLGTYISPRNGYWNRTALDVDLLWFSRLLQLRRNRIRQFIALNYTQGWKRLDGYEERLRFTKQNGLQAFDDYTIGVNRLVLNTETVMFTPIQPLGFRFAFFGFADAGTIGNASNPFKNSGYGAVGLGLRIRNERLVFGTLQIRLGIAFGRGGLADTQWISLSNTKRFEEYRFRPLRPEVVGFR